MDPRLAALQLLCGVGLILTAALTPDIRSNQASFTTLVTTGMGLLTNLMPSLSERRTSVPPPLGPVGK
jgi:hypothetical protein